MARPTARERAEHAVEAGETSTATVWAILDVADAIRESRQPTYSQEYPPDPEPAKAVLTDNGLRW